jgi:hypothetical protein
LVYADVPPGLHPVARRSLLAHLLKLEVDGAIQPDGEGRAARRTDTPLRCRPERCGC